MGMSEKDYYLIGDILGYFLKHSNELITIDRAIETIIINLGLEFKDKNPNFDENKWLKLTFERLRWDKKDKMFYPIKDQTKLKEPPFEVVKKAVKKAINEGVK